MPQLSIDEQPYDGVQITVTDLTYIGDDAFRVEVRTRVKDQDWRTVSVQRYRGLMSDFLLTMAKDVTAAWLYGEKRDVKRAADSIFRAARRHAEAHEAD